MVAEVEMKKRKKTPVTSETINRVLDVIDSSLTDSGALLPLSEDEFHGYEDIRRDDEIDIPEYLKDPKATLEHGRRILDEGFSVHFMVRTNKEISSALAQAARNGKNLSEEIRERMAIDRRNAVIEKTGK